MWSQNGEKMGLDRALGPSWGHVGSKMSPRSEKTSKRDFEDPPPKKEPKINQKSIRGDTFAWAFLDDGPDHGLCAFWLPKVLKNRVPEARFLDV